MSQRNVNLESLLRFQSECLRFCNHIAQLSAIMLEAVDVAACALRDEVVGKALSAATESGNALHTIGQKGCELMTAFVKKTEQDIQIWDTLSKQ